MGDWGSDEDLAGGQFDAAPRWQQFWHEESGFARAGIEYEYDLTDEPAEPPAKEPEDPRPPSLRDPLNRRLWTWAVVIALVGVVGRVIWYLRFEDDLFFRLGPDGDVYLIQAQAYLQGAIADPAGSILSSVYREVFPPGYPLFLTGIFKLFSRHDVFGQREHVLLTVRAIQWTLAGATTLMTFALARRVLFGFTALIPPALMTASIALVDLPNVFAYETLLMFLLTATLLLLVRAKEQPRRRDARLSVGLAGLLFGYGVLVQPRILVALPFLLAWSYRALGARVLVLLTIAALLAPAAWMVRNQAVFGQFVPISINGQASLYLDNVDPVGGTGFSRGAAPATCPRSDLMAPDLERRFDWARCMQNEGLAEIAEHPVESLLAVPDRLAALISPWNQTHARGTYYAPSWDYHRVVPGATRESPGFKAIDQTALVAWLAVYALLLIAGTVTLFVEGPGSTGRLLAIPLIALPLVHLVFHAENRFRVPLLPTMLIATTLGLLNLTEFLREYSRTRRRT